MKPLTSQPGIAAFLNFSLLFRLGVTPTNKKNLARRKLFPRQQIKPIWRESDDDAYEYDVYDIISV
jgi:hypothetical protein